VRRAAGTRPATRRTSSAASALGIPAAVTNNGRTEDPRMTGTAWIAVRNLDLATPITGLRLLAGDARADRQCGYRDCRTAVLPSYYGRPQETLHIHPA
jgi:hypothetical protein